MTIADDEDCLCQAAADKQAKLAALHEWTHIDATLASSKTQIQDPLLQGILDTSAKTAKKHSDTSKASSTRVSSPATGGDKSMKSETDRISGTTHGSSTTGDVSNGDETAGSNEEPDTELSKATDIDLSLDCDDDPIDWPPSSQPVRPSVRPARSGPDSNNDFEGEDVTNAIRQELDLGLGTKKHDLQQLANSGQAGRILFIFEKVSGVQLDVNPVAAVEEASGEDDEGDEDGL